MPKFWILAATFAVLVAPGFAQDGSIPPECPALRVIGPATTLSAGEKARFSVEITPQKPEFRFKYHWYLSYGSVGAGQGTASIEVERPPSSRLTATIDVAGGPDDSTCLHVVSETAVWDVPAEAEKIGSVGGGVGTDSSFLFNRVKSRLESYAEDRLVVFLSGPANLVAEREKEIEAGLGPPIVFRTTISKIYAEKEFIEFWIVPPGASDPSKCESCESLRTGTVKQDCPEVLISGPQGIVLSGNAATFSVSLPDDSLKFVWTTSLGTIENGAGSRMIIVRTSSSDENVLTVSLRIVGLPVGCKNFATMQAVVAPIRDPLKVDEYGRISPNEQRGKLDEFLKSLRGVPTQVGYVIVQYKMRTSSRAIQRRIQFIKNHVFGLRRFPRDRVVIMRTPGPEDSTKLYRAPANLGDALCPDCTNNTQ